jgi:hypothetical protein
LFIAFAWAKSAAQTLAKTSVVMTKTCKTYQRDWDVCIDAPPPCACKSHTERERCMQTETETHCLGQVFQEQKIVRNQICHAEKIEKQSPCMRIVSERMW